MLRAGGAYTRSLSVVKRATVKNESIKCARSSSKQFRALSSKVEELLDSLEYGPAPEDDGPMHAWLDSHDRKFGAFINGEWQPTSGQVLHTAIAPSTGEALCEVSEAVASDADAAIQAARTAYPGWSSLSGHARARHLYSIARHLQKHSRLLAVVESMDNGKPIRETRDADVPLAVRHFYHHAGLQL